VLCLCQILRDRTPGAIGDASRIGPWVAAEIASEAGLKGLFEEVFFD
jgi:hypothetical protein